MPTISGYELIPILKKLENISQASIVIMSGKNQAEDVARAVLLGASDYIVKPLDPLVVQQKLEGSSSSEESTFYSVDIGGSSGVAVAMTSAIHILSFSEFGLRLNSQKKINPGETIELSSVPIDIFGKASLLVRCLSCEESKVGKFYTLQMTYIGMTETQRQIIRTNCRKLAIKSKIGAA